MRKKTCRPGRVMLLLAAGCGLILLLLYSGTLAYTALKPVEEGELALHSPNAVLLRLRDGEVLLDRAGEERIYPASLTKIMTAVVALEGLDDLEQTIPLPEELFPPLYEQNASLAGFLPGEEVPAIDLIYGVMLPSGAEASVGLALYVAGSEQAFVQRMNQKARELGMESTHFVNVCGLDDEDHYSTAMDLARLLTYALDNPTFYQVFTQLSHATAATNLHPEGFTLKSTLARNLSGIDDPNGFLGGKTGYTGKAGLCLASLAEVEGERYILVTAGAPGDHYTEQYNLSDAIAVYAGLRAPSGP